MNNTSQTKDHKTSGSGGCSVNLLLTGLIFQIIRGFCYIRPHYKAKKKIVMLPSPDRP